MKKILLITLEYPPQIGGVATYCHDLALALAADRVTVMAPGGNDQYAKHKQKREWDKMQPYRVIRQKFLFPPFLWPRWLRMIWPVARMVRQEKIEIIFVQQVLPVGYAAVVVKKLFHIPFLLFSHGTDLLAGTATAWKKRMVRMISRQADQIIFNSQSLQRRFLRVLPEFKEKSLVLYPWPEAMFMDPTPPGRLAELKARYALEGKKVLLSVSRMDEGKGFPQLINYLPRILSKVPHLVWFIVGSGPKQEEIITLIQKNNLQNIVRFIGEIPHADLHLYYHLADLFVLLTHPDEGREEGLGLVFLEAAAAGLPIVAGRSGGVEEAVRHEKTGLVVDTYNAEQCISAITKLLQATDYARALGQAAKERIEAEFVGKKQVEKLRPWLE